MYEPLKKRNEAMASKINNIEKEVGSIRTDLKKFKEELLDLKELMVSIYNSVIEKLDKED